jgi:hypothetical protein
MPAKKAIVARAHRLRVIGYHVLTTREPDHELGATDHAARDRPQIVHRAVQRLTRLGYRVTVEPVAPAADSA